MDKEPKRSQANVDQDKWDSLSGVPRNIPKHVMEFMERSQSQKKQENPGVPEDMSKHVMEFMERSQAQKKQENPGVPEDIPKHVMDFMEHSQSQSAQKQSPSSPSNEQYEVVAIQNEDGTLSFPGDDTQNNPESLEDGSDGIAALPPAGNPNAIPLGPASNPNAIPLPPAGNPNAIPLPPAGDPNHELEEKQKHELEELDKLEKEQKHLQDEKDKLEKELKDLPEQEFDPLVAINADFTHDRDELVRDIAEIQLNEETSKAGLIKRIWKGNLFKKYYQKKRERELLSGDKLVDVEGTDMTIDEMIRDRSNSTIQRFVLGAVESLDYIHTKIATNNRGTEDPGAERLVEADRKTTEAVHNAVRAFAEAKIPEGGNLEDLKQKFIEDMHRIKAGNHDDGRDDGLLIDNYLDVAIQARERVEHDISIDKVMEGFKVYNAEVRDSVRTEAHRDAIDKIVNKYETSRFGSIMPPEIIAGALGTAVALTQSGARALGGVGIGIGVSGLMSGLRERNRVTEDRARMMRDIANGGEYGGESSSNRSKKYEARIGGTLYETRSANELVEGINGARENGDNEALLRAIAEARVRIDFSDSEQKDLISYSSTGKRGTERLELDMATIRAERSLSPEDQEKVATIRSQIQREIRGDVDEQDRDFRKLRTAQALKQAGKTVLVGSAIFFASQEVIAAISPDKIGIFEKAGLLDNQNNTDASETILAGAVGGRGVQTIDHVPADDTVRRDMLKDAGFTETQTSPGGTHVETTLVETDPKDAVNQVNLHRSWANNGTRISDGDELRAYLQNGTMTSGMLGDSTMPNGAPVDYANALAEGRVKAYLTIDGATFELAPNSGSGLSWGQNGVFTTATGETIKAVSDSGERLYEYFEIGIENGVRADGSIDVTMLATDPQLHQFGGKIQQVVETLVEDPAEYTYTKTTPVFYGGVVAAPTDRTGLGGPALRRQTPPTQPQRPNGQGDAEPTPSDAPAQPPEDTTTNQPSGDTSPAQPVGDTVPSDEGNTDTTNPQGETPDDNGDTNNPQGETQNDSPEQAEARAEAVRVAGYMGDDIINLMTRTEPLSDAEYTSLPAWWGGLTDDERGDLRRWTINNADSPYGQGLKNFIIANSAGN